MTFWQDAKPATPRFPRGHRRREGRRSRAGRLGAAGLAVAVVTALVLVGFGGGDDDATARAARDPDRPATGRVPLRWTRTLPAWPAAIARDGRAVIAVGGDRVSAVAIADGELRWQTRVGRVDDRFAVHGDTVLVAIEAGFVALDRVTGERRWEVRSPERTGPVALVGGESDGDDGGDGGEIGEGAGGDGGALAVVSTARGGLLGLDPATGRSRWSVRLSGYVRSPFAVDPATGLIAGVWQADRDHTVLRLVDSETGTVRWERVVGRMAGAPTFAGRAVLVSSGDDERTSAIEAYAVDGGARRWRTPVDAPSQPDLVPVVDGRHVVAVDQAGTVSRLRVRDGRSVWRRRTDALTTYARPARVGDVLLVWNEGGEVLTIDRGSGHIRARRRVAGIPVGLVVRGGTVVVAQRLLRGPPLQAFGAAAVAAPARRTG